MVGVSVVEYFPPDEAQKVVDEGLETVVASAEGLDLNTALRISKS